MLLSLFGLVSRRHRRQRRLAGIVINLYRRAAPDRRAALKIRRFLRLIASATALVAPVSAHAESFTTLYSFAGSADGATPYAGLVNASGVLYGTTSAGGASGLGTIFSYDLATGSETVLYSFKGGADGAEPASALCLRTGKLYGTTAKGGTGNSGTVFRFDLKTGHEAVLRNFSVYADGSGPVGALVFSNGVLLGATVSGGANGFGALYSVNARSGASAVLYSFKGIIGAVDGLNPSSGLTAIGGLFYGATGLGGSHDCGGEGCGTIYSYDASSGRVAIVHAFTATGDGMVPVGDLTAARGLLFGATNYGPTFLAGGNVFQFNPNTSAVKSLAAFTGGQGTGPIDGVTVQATGIYGVLPGDSSGKMGSVYKAGLKSGQLTILHAFSGGADGGGPTGRLIAYRGAFYGVTANSNGTLYKIVP